MSFVDLTAGAGLMLLAGLLLGARLRVAALLVLSAVLAVSVVVTEIGLGVSWISVLLDTVLLTVALQFGYGAGALAAAALAIRRDLSSRGDDIDRRIDSLLGRFPFGDH